MQMSVNLAWLFLKCVGAYYQVSWVARLYLYTGDMALWWPDQFTVG